MDTSLIVALLVTEEDSDAAQQWLVDNQHRPLFISPWVRTEVSSALSIKTRTRQISGTTRERALQSFRALASSSLNSQPVEARHFDLAADFTDRSNLGLRAGDALHLAIASTAALTICTRDRRFASAGSAFGISTELV